MLSQADSLSDHKIRHGSQALAALASCSLDDDISHKTTSSTDPLPSLLPTPSQPVDISSSSSSIYARASSSYEITNYDRVDTPAAAATAPAAVKSPSSSGSRSLSFLACFSSGGKSRVLGDNDDDIPPSFLSSCEVGIRPSFYWVDAQQTTQEQRLEAEASYRFMKADCQDEAVVMHNFAGIAGLTFVGVFDGHGPNGRAAAKFASSRLPHVLAEQISALKSRSDRKRLNAMKEACRQVHEAMQSYKKCGFDASLSGTTACFAMINGSTVLLANVGDSRCVVARQVDNSNNNNNSNSNTSNNNKMGSSSRSNVMLKAIPLTQDAKPNLPEEHSRIIAAGGVVQQLLDESGQRCGAHRVFRRGDNLLPGLAMSRSLGDIYAHNVGVTWTPALTSYTLSPKDVFLVLATDGLWDIMDNDTTVDFIHRYRHQRDAGISCAEALTLEAQERWKASHDEALVDDISVAILHTAPLPPPERTASLPRALTRAASCNDEANQIWSAWREGDADEVDPSIHAPQKYFEHLYRKSLSNSSTVRSGSLSSSLSMKRSGDIGGIGGGSVSSSKGGSLLDATVQRDEIDNSGNDDDDNNVLQQQQQGIHHASEPSSPMPQQKYRRPSVLVTTTEDNNNNTSSSTGIVVDDGSARTSPFIAQPPQEDQTPSLLPSSSSSSSTATTTAAAAAIDVVAPLNRRSSSKPIPVGKSAHMTTTDTADDHLDTTTARGPDGFDPDHDPLNTVYPPIRKAYPSTATIHSFPSWDGGFHQSFKSDSSLHGLNDGGDTPRSSESNISMHDHHHSHHSRVHSRAPHRGELHHEGKVHRGIPRSLSSAGLLSHGRISTDSESYTAGSSRVGSLEESILAMSPRRGLLRSSSDVHGKIMSVPVNSRSSSYNTLVLGQSASNYNLHNSSSSFDNNSSSRYMNSGSGVGSGGSNSSLALAAQQQPPVTVGSGNRSVVLVRDVHTAAVMSSPPTTTTYA